MGVALKLAPRTIIAVRGPRELGEAGDTAYQLAKGIAKHIKESDRACAPVIASQKTIVDEELDEHADPQGTIEIPSYSLGVERNGNTQAELQVLEFRWGEEPAFGEKLLGNIASIYRVLAGIPRIGFFGLERSNCETANTQLLKLLAMTLWSLLLVRLLGSLTLYVLCLLLDSSTIRVDEFLLCVDFSINVAIVGYLGTLLVAYLRATFDSDALRGNLIALGITYFVYQLVPSAVIRALELTSDSGTESRSDDLNSAIIHFRIAESGEVLTARWFYAPNTIPGIWPYVMLFGIFCTLLFGVIYIGFTQSKCLAGKSATPVASQMRWLLPFSSSFLAFALASSALIELCELNTLLSGEIPMVVAGAQDALASYSAKFCDFVLAAGGGALLLVATSSLFPSTTLGILRSLERLVIIAPEIPVIDRTRFFRLLFGGRDSDSDLYETQARRLVATINASAPPAKHPATIVCSGIDGVVVLEALARSWNCAPPICCPNLITVGLPIDVFPSLLRSDSNSCPDRIADDRKPVAEWRNLFFDCGAFGQHLLDDVFVPPLSSRYTRSSGGPITHDDFYSETCVAENVLELAYREKQDTSTQRSQ